MSLEQQIPVLVKKTQMSGDSGRPQCGLTSLLPMSCRGRAVAFARDLHTRLRHLGTVEDDDNESSWLAKNNNNHPSNTATQRELDTFYDFELECESPSSPVDDYDAPFPSRNSADHQDPPFYDVDSEPEVKEQAKLMLQQPDKTKNGFRFSTSFYADCSPVKIQPIPRENGHADKPLYSPITFEGCVRHNSYDEVDCIARSLSVDDSNGLDTPALVNSKLDSDSEFEYAKTDLSETNDEVFVSETELKDDITEPIENISITENIPVENNVCDEMLQNQTTLATQNSNERLEIITSEVPDDKELSPSPEIEPNLLSPETEVEDHDDDDRPQRVRRCSSLKTGKTPPGTPGRKKIVRFADVLGLDLADVKTFMDEIPVIPKSAYDDLTGCDVQCSPPTRAPPRFSSLTLVPLFQLTRDVTDKLEKQNVCLESARVCDGVHVTICGYVRVRNLDFHKTVHVRYTMNSWKTFTDLQTTYVQGSCDGYSDRFQFILYAPCIASGQRLELAVRFQCKGQQFWDNNNGVNYCFDCLALGATAPVPSSPVSLHPTLDWHPSFY